MTRILFAAFRSPKAFGFGTRRSFRTVDSNQAESTILQILKRIKDLISNRLKNIAVIIGFVHMISFEQDISQNAERAIHMKPSFITQ